MASDPSPHHPARVFKDSLQTVNCRGLKTSPSAELHMFDHKEKIEKRLSYSSMYKILL